MTGKQTTHSISMPTASLKKNDADVYAVRENIKTIAFADDGKLYVELDDGHKAIYGYHLIQSSHLNTEAI